MFYFYFAFLKSHRNLSDVGHVSLKKHLPKRVKMKDQSVKFFFKPHGCKICLSAKYLILEAQQGSQAPFCRLSS